MKLSDAKKTSYNVGDEKLTPLEAITHYNNFYEFGTDKADPAENAKNFRTSPWTLKVEGDVAKPMTFDLDGLFKIAPLEERIYRHRCVEAWSIVVPWIGFPLAALLKQVEPTPKAKYVAFETYYDPKQMPQARGPASIFLMWKACVWMKPCIRWRCWRWDFTAKRCPIRMARPSGWWCRGNTATKARSRW